MKKPLVIIIHHDTGADIHYAGDVDVVSVGTSSVQDRVYQYTPSSASAKALQHFVGPKKYWSNIEYFAPDDPDALSRSRAALDPKSKVTLYPSGSPYWLRSRPSKGKSPLKARVKIKSPPAL